MSENRDPFELLPGFTDPEPDPVVMNATIARSREAFTNGRALSDRSRQLTFIEWARRSANWLAPVGAVAIAAAVVIAIVPSLSPSSRTDTADRELVADRPLVRPSAPTLSRGGEQLIETPNQNSAGNRMGMTVPQGGETLNREPLPQIVSSYQGDNIRLGLRLDAEALEIYLPDVSGEQILDAQNVMPGEQIEILSAARLMSDLIAVHFKVGDSRFWRIYAQTDGAYHRDPARSTLVSDAADKAEVERRLEGN